MNDRRLRVSARRDLTDCLLACGLPFAGREGRALALAETDRVLAKTAGVRRMGSAALDLCAVAAGQVDAYFEVGLSRWDYAAGVLIAAEAGAVTVVEHDDASDRAFVFAAAPGIGSELLKLLRDQQADMV